MAQAERDADQAEGAPMSDIDSMIRAIVRDEAERMWSDGKKVPLVFSPEIITRTSEIYRSLIPRITDLGFRTFQDEFLN